MDRTCKWLVSAVAIVAVSSSTSAFAQTKPKNDDKTKTQHVRGDDEKETSKERKAKKERSEPAGVTTVTSADATARPPGAEREQRLRINGPLMVTGAVVLAAAYVPSATVGIVGRDDERALIAPVVGPWLSLGQKDCEDEPCNNEGLDKTMLVASGVAQGAGLVAIALSLFIPPPPRGSVPGFAGASSVRFTPLSFGRSGAGFGAVGMF